MWKSHIIAPLRIHGQAKLARKNQIFVKSDYYSVIAQGIARRLFTEDDYFIEVALRC